MTPALVLAAATAAAPVESPSRDCAESGVRAEYMMPTERRRPGAYGALRAWGGLRYDGAFLAGVVLDHRAVFEDVAPRLADLDGDCDPEVLTVEAHETEGARVVIWEADRGALRTVAATPAAGRADGFVAPLGVADLDGDGALDLALVADPHGEGRLEVWTLAPGGLTRLAAAPGFSNHRFGDPGVSGGLRFCAGRAEMVLADAAWTEVRVARVERAALVSESAGSGVSTDSLARALACR